MQSAKYLDLYYFDYIMSLRVISVLNGKVLCGRLSAGGRACVRCVHVRSAAKCMKTDALLFDFKSSTGPQVFRS